MQYVLFLSLALLVWAPLFVARKFSLWRQRGRQKADYAKGTPIAQLISPKNGGGTHHWLAYSIGFLMALGASYGASWWFELQKTAEFGLDVALGCTGIICVVVGILHGLHWLPLPSPNHTLPEA